MEPQYKWFWILSTASIMIWLQIITLNYYQQESKPEMIVLCEITPNDFKLSDEEPKSSTIMEISFPNENESISSYEEKIAVINNPDSPKLLVNKTRKLPNDFSPRQLIIPDVRFPFDEYHEKKQMRAVAALALEDLFEKAESSGLYLYAVSGYRSYERQENIFNLKVENRGLEETLKVSAYPGTSEHQTGFSMDISSLSNDFELTQSFGETKEGIWVAHNAHKSGFIVRYPHGKENITGYSYEPWHLRYIGIDEATYLYENNLTLEEAYNIKK